jgi:hypothetical protein
MVAEMRWFRSPTRTTEKGKSQIHILMAETIARNKAESMKVHLRDNEIL